MDLKALTSQKRVFYGKETSNSTSNLKVNPGDKSVSG